MLGARLPPREVRNRAPGSAAEPLLTCAPVASRPPLLVAALSLLLVAGPARGQDPWQPGIATHLVGEHGLTGFGSMVDGQIPSPLLAPPWPTGPLGTYSSRTVLRYGAGARHRELEGQLATYEVARERQAITALHGLTVRGFDLAVGLPYRFDDDRFEVEGAPGRLSEQDQGLGAVLVSGKLGLRVPKFMFGDWAVAGIAFYALGRVSTREETSDPSEVEAGVAITGPYGYGFRYQANVAVVQREGGVTALLARGGASSVPIAGPDLVVRAFGHLVGVQHEGGYRPSIDLELGTQLLVLGHLTIDVVGSVRLLETGFVEPALVRGIREGAGDRVRRVRGEGAFTASFGVGVVF